MMTASADSASDTSSFLLENGQDPEGVREAPTAQPGGWLLQARRVGTGGLTQETRVAGIIGTGFLAMGLMAVVAYQAELVPRGAGMFASKAPVSLIAVEKHKDDDDDHAPKCEAAQPGTQCYKDIAYAKSHIEAHPEWYVGLQTHSSSKAFQAFLHKQHTNTGKPRCPKPCGHVETIDKHLLSGKCHTAEKGEDCYNHVLYTMKENLPKHPEWYPGLAKDADFRSVQAVLYKQRVCPKPCGVKDKVPKQKKCHHLKGKAKKECENDNEAASKMTRCHTAFAGDACYGDVLWAMDNVNPHPDWYPGLTNESSFAEFQAFLHKQHNGNIMKLCPMPCNLTAVKLVEKIDVKHHCHTSSPGESCYKSIAWVIEEGIVKHPEWYENMTSDATFEEVQARLNKDEDSSCKRIPCPCHTAVKGEKCYDSIQWVFKVGLVNHTSWYKGLQENSTSEDVQIRLHEDAHPTCPMPCRTPPWANKATEADAVVA